jgi:hypothetical protein
MPTARSKSGRDGRSSRATRGRVSLAAPVGGKFEGALKLAKANPADKQIKDKLDRARKGGAK